MKRDNKMEIRILKRPTWYWENVLITVPENKEIFQSQIWEEIRWARDRDSKVTIWFCNHKFSDGTLGTFACTSREEVIKMLKILAESYFKTKEGKNKFENKKENETKKSKKRVRRSKKTL